MDLEDKIKDLEKRLEYSKMKNEEYEQLLAINSTENIELIDKLKIYEMQNQNLVCQNKFLNENNNYYSQLSSENQSKEFHEALLDIRCFLSKKEKFIDNKLHLIQTKLDKICSELDNFESKVKHLECLIIILVLICEYYIFL